MACIQEIKFKEACFAHSADRYFSKTDFPMHIHDTYEILCFVSGDADYAVEGQIYRLRPGCIMIMRSAETHRLMLQSDAVYERYVINFRPDALFALGLPPSLLRPFTDRPLGERNRYLSDEFPTVSPLNLCQKLGEESQNGNSQTALFCNLVALLSAISSAFEKQPRLKPAKKNYTSDAIIDYINENLLAELSLPALSERFHISPSQINRIFRQSTGASVYHYILVKRLILAQELIAKGESATVAGQRCGFNDYSAFYRLYKKHFGTSPTAVKKQILSLMN